MAKKAKRLPKANDNYENFDDEFTLAQLIQNAAARGLTSVKGALFAREMTSEEENAFEILEAGLDYDNPDEYGDAEEIAMYLDRIDDLVKCDLDFSEEIVVDKGGALLSKPPDGATCACALGAQSLTPKLSNPLNIKAMQGNDDNGSLQTIIIYDDLRSYQIGAAYEEALRPE